MRKQKETPYSTFSLEKIDAPKAKKAEPKSSTIKGSTDLRIKKTKV